MTSCTCFWRTRMTIGVRTFREPNCYGVIHPVPVVDIDDILTEPNAFAGISDCPDPYPMSEPPGITPQASHSLLNRWVAFETLFRSHPSPLRLLVEQL